MADRMSKETRGRIMSRIRSKSGIERVPERMRFLNLRSHPKKVYGNPDYANKKRRIAVFIDGCFWHGCPLHYREPKSNRGYWVPKIMRNVERDREVTARLENLGWHVVRVWEHDLQGAKVAKK